MILSHVFFSLHCICKDTSCRHLQQDRRTTSQLGRSAWTTQWLNWSTRPCVSRIWSSCRSTEPMAGNSTTSMRPEHISARHSLYKALWSLQLVSFLPPSATWPSWSKSLRRSFRSSGDAAAGCIGSTGQFKTCFLRLTVLFRRCAGSKSKTWTGRERTTSCQEEPNCVSLSQSRFFF